MSDATPCPDTILAAIPWYPEGLTAEECGAVEAHAADCRACRAELAFLRGEDEPALEIPDPDRIYERVLERIAAPEEEPEVRPLPAFKRFSERAKGPVSLAAGLMVALMSGMLTTGAIWAVRVAPAYEMPHTAGAAEASRHLEIVFAPDATASEMTRALLDARATVVSGPTPEGVYRVRLAPGGDPERALESLTGTSGNVVAFAAPATPY